VGPQFCKIAKSSPKFHPGLFFFQNHTTLSNNKGLLFALLLQPSPWEEISKVVFPLAFLLNLPFSTLKMVFKEPKILS